MRRFGIGESHVLAIMDEDFVNVWVAVLAQNDPITLLCAPSQTLELREWNEKVLLHLALALTEAINKKAAVSTLLCRTQVL